MKPACPKCGYIHAANDARTVGRFGGTPGYIAATAPTPVRQTRAEAEADECTWRRERTPTKPYIDPSPSSRPLAVAEDPKPEPPPFPAALMETAARAKAWRDFLAQARLSLLIWRIDDSLHGSCQDVVAWLHECSDQLATLLSPVQPDLLSLLPEAGEQS